VRLCERNNSADTKARERRRGGGAPGARAEIPLQPVEKTMVRQAVTLQSMEVHGGADLHLQPVEGTPRQRRWMPEGSCDSVGRPALEQAPARTCGPVERGAHAGTGLLARLVTLWGTHAGAACS